MYAPSHPSSVRPSWKHISFSQVKNMFFQKQIYVCVVQHVSLKTSRIISVFWEMLFLEAGCETIRLSWAFFYFMTNFTRKLSVCYTSRFSVGSGDISRLKNRNLYRVNLQYLSFFMLLNKLKLHLLLFKVAVIDIFVISVDQKKTQSFTESFSSCLSVQATTSLFGSPSGGGGDQKQRILDSRWTLMLLYNCWMSK